MQTQTKGLAALTAATALWIGTASIHPAHAAPEPLPDVSPSSAPSPTPEPVTMAEYRVRAGDYLEAIAQEHHIGWPSLYEANPAISNPDMIYPDQALAIPDRDIPVTRSIAQLARPVDTAYAPQPLPATSTSPRTTQTTPPARAVTTRPTTGVTGSYASLVGVPYQYGGTTPAGFDCSGLTLYLAAQQGRALPRTASAQYAATTRIGKADLRAGDLVFFNPNHVGMYIGNGQIIHATVPGRGVEIDALDTVIAYNGYMGAGRL